MVLPDIDEAQRVIEYVFRRPELLEEALTHRSYINELKAKGGRDNERLEFLGDAIIALIMSEYLTATFPDDSEGELSKKKARLVSEVSLAKAARELNLGRFLRLGRGEERTQGREKNSLLANALEALIAAVYLDGGLEAAQALAHRTLSGVFQELKEVNGVEYTQDYKTQYQEWCQKRFDTLPRYVTVCESGPDHQKTFEVQLIIKGEVAGVGIGRTKKEAEQMAAKQALDQIERV
jgi:ribonuclease-3